MGQMGPQLQEAHGLVNSQGGWPGGQQRPVWRGNTEAEPKRPERGIRKVFPAENRVPQRPWVRNEFKFIPNPKNLSTGRCVPMQSRSQGSNSAFMRTLPPTRFCPLRELRQKQPPAPRLVPACRGTQVLSFFLTLNMKALLTVRVLTGL